MLAFVIGLQPIPRDPDLWFHLASGEHILSHRSVPDTDPFSFTRAGELWVPHAWLFDVGVALSWNHLGPRMTEALFAGAFAMTFLIVFSILTRGGVSGATAMGICLALAIGAANTRGVRPQVLSLLACAIVVALMLQHRRAPSPRIAWVVPPLFLLWAQLHAACVMGLVVMCVWFAGRCVDALTSAGFRAYRRELLLLVLTIGASCIAVLITPHRISHFAYVRLTAGLEALRHTQEWQTPALWPVEVPDIYAYLLLAGIAMSIWRGWRRIDRIEWSVLGLAAAVLILAMSAVRHIPLACVAGAPLLACAWKRHDTSPTTVLQTLRQHALPITVAIGIALTVLWDFPNSAYRRYAAVEPMAGARALATLGGTRNVFTTYNTGAYVLHEAPERLKVFVDSRADVYGDQVCATARRTQQGKDWEELFAQENITAAVLERDDPLVAILVENAHWRKLATDRGTVTFVQTKR